MPPSLEAALANLDAYPRWFVALCLAVVAMVAVWLLVKILKWTLYLAAVAVVVWVLGGIAAWWLG